MNGEQRAWNAARAVLAGVLAAALAGAFAAGAVGPTSPAAAAEAAPAAPAASVAAPLREAYLKALKGENFIVARRAAQRLGTMGKLDAELRRALLDNIVAPAQKERGYEGMDAAFALAASGTEALPDVLKALANEKPDTEACRRLLICVGRMGPAAGKDAVPVLQQKLGEAATDLLKAPIRVVLAQVGHTAADNYAAIVAGITTERGDKTPTAETMAFVGARDWVSDQMIAVLTANLKRGWGESAGAAMALGVIGPRAAAAVTDLKPRANDLYHAMALIRLSPEKQDAVLRNVLRRFAPYGCNDESEWLPMFYAAWTVVDDKTVAALVDVLRDPDKDMVLAPGAAAMVRAIGLRANAAAPRLIEIIEAYQPGPGPESIRGSAYMSASALGAVADAASLPKLKTLARRAWSGVGADIEESIKAIEAVP